MQISDEKYVALTTYRKNGEAKVAPVWIVPLGDGRVGFTTASSSWKVKRIRNDPRVVLQPCDRSGKITPGSSEVTGTATVAQGSSFEEVKTLIKSKYGFQFTMISAIGKVAERIGKGSGTDTAVMVTLD